MARARPSANDRLCLAYGAVCSRPFARASPTLAAASVNPRRLPTAGV